VLIRLSFATLAAAVLGLAVMIVPAEADPTTELAPTGCTTWIDWVHDGSGHYNGKGNVQCAAGRYRSKNVCRNLQTGEGYVIYGPPVDAPNLTSVTCYPGNSAESVHAVEDPPPPGVTGCTTWTEWVHDGTNHYHGRAKAQCDSGNYMAQVLCRNLQTGQAYVLNSHTAAAPHVAAITCASGNTAESVQAVPSADPPSDPGPWGVRGPDGSPATE
jgi:hypothetical protein